MIGAAPAKILVIGAAAANQDLEGIFSQEGKWSLTDLHCTFNISCTLPLVVIHPPHVGSVLPCGPVAHHLIQMDKTNGQCWGVCRFLREQGSPPAAHHPMLMNRLQESPAATKREQGYGYIQSTGRTTGQDYWTVLGFHPRFP